MDSRDSFSISVPEHSQTTPPTPFYKPQSAAQLSQVTPVISRHIRPKDPNFISSFQTPSPPDLITPQVSTICEIQTTETQTNFYTLSAITCLELVTDLTSEHV